MSSKKKRTENTTEVQKQTLDPRMDAMLYGTSSPKTAPWNYGNYGQPETSGGLFGTATELFNQGPQSFFPGQTYAGLNPIQRGALGGTVNWLSSPQSMGGYQAAQTVGNRLINSGAPQIQLPEVPTEAPDYLRSMMGAEAPRVSAGSVTVNQGQNPWLTENLQNLRDTSIQDFQRNLLPSIRAGAQAAGGYGSSRQGIAEGLAMGDLSRNISNAQAGLLGQVYESDANRRLSAETTNAQLATQANLANASNALASRGLDLDIGRTMADYGLNAQQLRQSGLLGAGALNLQGQQLAGNQALAGAGLLQDAAQIPTQNLAGILDAGTAYQTDAQNRINAARERFDFEQQSPWLNLARYQAVLQPNTELGQTQTMNRNSTTTESSGGLGSALGSALSLASLFTPAAGWASLFKPISSASGFGSLGGGVNAMGRMV